MAVPTAAWIAESVKRGGQRPIYITIISLDNQELKLVDVDQEVGQIDALAVLDKPRPISATIEPFSGKSTVSQINLAILDKNGFFSKIASKEFLLNRKVVIKIGFQDIDEADFFTEYTGKIKDFSMPTPGRWVVQVRDSQSDLDENVPSDATGIIVNTAFWNKPDVTGYIVASAQDSPPKIFTQTQSFNSGNVTDRTFMVRLGVDTLRLYQVGSITVGASFTTWDIGSATPLSDGVVNSLASELLGDNLASIILNIMKRTGLPDDNIQVASIVSERDNFLPTIRARRILGQPTRALTLIQELAEVAALSIFPDGDNKLSAKFFAPPNPHDDVFSLDTTRMQPEGNVAVTPDVKLFANRIVIRGNHDGSQFKNNENFGRIDIFADIDSQNDNKKVKSKTIQTEWLHSSVTDSSWYSVIGNKRLKRTSQPPRKLKTSAFLDMAIVNIADMVSVTHPEIPGQPNAKTTVGVEDELWQLISKGTNVVGGEIPVELLDARLDKQPGWISHAGQPDYPDAAGLDRRHAYIGTPESGGRTFVNGGTEDGYYIQ